jgi:hypothetical protein
MAILFRLKIERTVLTCYEVTLYFRNTKDIIRTVPFHIVLMPQLERCIADSVDPPHVRKHKI